MIIDAHVYSLPARLRNRYCSFPASETAAASAIHKSAPVAEVELALRLSAPEEIMASMKDAGIDVSVLTALPWNTPILCSENNEHILEYAAMYDSLLPVCSVQPGNSGWRKEAKKCIDRGAIGLKINPAWQGFCLDSTEAASLAGFCADAGVFLEIHIDHAFKVSPASAAALCLLVKACPSSRVLATHLGGLIGLYAIHPPVAALLQNVWFDTAVSSTLQFVDFYIQAGLGQRVVFGSDFPFNHSHSQQQVLDGLRARGYAPETLHGICGGNFLDLHGQRLLP